MLISRGLRLGYICRIDGVVNDVEKLMETLDLGKMEVVDNVDMTNSHDRIKYNNDIYYVFKTRLSTTIYKLLPLVCDDETFHWKERVLRNRVRNQWCEVHSGSLSFNILYYTETGDAHITVQWNGKSFDHEWLRDQVVDNKALRKFMEDYKRSFLYYAKVSCKNEEEVA